jgi:outer membrane protein OmpA-like peptidoglycan-associated protein
MNKRIPATASRHARTPKPTAKAQRAKPAVVRSPKPGAQHLVEAIPAEAPAKGRNKSKQPVPVVENPRAALQAAAVVETPAAALPAARMVENPPAAFQDAGKPAMTNNASNTGFDFSSATANVQAYQAKLLQLALANLQLAFEMAQRLATIRSPLDIFGVTAEFTSKRIALFRKYA